MVTDIIYIPSWGETFPQVQTVAGDSNMLHRHDATMTVGGASGGCDKKREPIPDDLRTLRFPKLKTVTGEI